MITVKSKGTVEAEISKVVSFHTDISTRTGERVIVFKLSSGLENELLKIIQKLSKSWEIYVI